MSFKFSIPLTKKLLRLGSGRFGAQPLKSIYSGCSFQQDGTSSEWMFLGTKGALGWRAELVCHLENDDTWTAEVRALAASVPEEPPLTLPFPDSSRVMLAFRDVDLDDRANLSARENKWRLEADQVLELPFSDLDVES